MPLRRTRLAFADRQDLALGIDRITVEHGGWHFNFVPAQIGDGLLADVRDAHPRDDRCKRQARIHQRLSELAVLGVFLIEMQWMLVHRQQREPGIVRSR